MLADIIWSEAWIFLVLFLGVSVLGFAAGRWRRGDLDLLEEWGLAGRRFGTVVTWFLLGGDLYTAYTFVAVPALVFSSGALGLFAVPYTVIVYPLVFLIMPRLWQVARNRGYVTGADFVRDRFDSHLLALLIALTGIVATMPYIALQMFGVQVVLAQMGVPVEAALIIAFAVLAVFTYVSGLRAPALIALVKDLLIWIVVIVAVIYIPSHLGGFGSIFAKVPAKKLVLPSSSQFAYASLALGSAAALFLYPHAITGTLASRSQTVVRRNAAFLPIYSFMLGLIALLGYMAIAAGVKPGKDYGANGIVPALLQKEFNGPFAGVAFAAIAIGALVPAAVMSIAAANLFTHNVWKEYVHRDAGHAEYTNVSKIASLAVKVGALVFILAVPSTDIINFQLAGGVWILQTLPAVFLGLWWGWLNRWALVAGWAAGMGLGTWALVHQGWKSTFAFGTGTLMYIGFAAIVVNLAVTLGGSAIALAAGGRQRAGTIADRDFEALPAG